MSHQLPLALCDLESATVKFTSGIMFPHLPQLTNKNDSLASIFPPSLCCYRIEPISSFAWFWNKKNEGGGWGWGSHASLGVHVDCFRKLWNLCWHIHFPLLMSNGRAKLTHQRNCHLREHLEKSSSLRKWAICFFYNLPPTLLVRVEQLGWKWWIALDGWLLKSCNFNGSRWAEDNQLFWQQNKLSSASFPKWPCTFVRCKSPKHFSSFDFLSYLLLRFIPLLSFKFWSYLIFFTWTFKSLIHWLAINRAGMQQASFSICLDDEYWKCLVIWHW